MRDIVYDNYFWQDDNVRLRAMSEKDLDYIMYNGYDTPARVILNYEVELPPTEEEAIAFIEGYKDFKKSKGRTMFTIENMDGDVVGSLNFNSVDEKNGTFSIGMQIDRDHRSKGYGTSAMRIVMRYAFLERRLNKYYGSVHETNIGSATMMRKLGCLEEGIRRQMVYSKGKYYDEILFGMTKDEFIAKNGG